MSLLYKSRAETSHRLAVIAAAYANAQEIAEFLNGANPNWPQADVLSAGLVAAFPGKFSG